MFRLSGLGKYCMRPMIRSACAPRGLVRGITTIAGKETSFVELEPTSPAYVHPPYPMPPTARVENADSVRVMMSLMDWLARNDGKISQKVLLGPLCRFLTPDASDDGNWGGLALQNIPKDEVVATIPLSRCIFPLEKSPKHRPAAYYSALRELLTLISPDAWQVRLGIRVLSERSYGEESAYAPYINALPSTFSSIPLFYQKHEIEIAQYPGFLPEQNFRASQINQFIMNLRKSPHLTKLADLVFNGYTISAADLAWGVSAVSSRAFQAPIPASLEGTSVNSGQDASVDAKTMIPFVDLLNHSFNNNCRIVFTRDVTDKAKADALGRDAYSVQIKTTVDIIAGEELSINYYKPQNHNSVIAEVGIQNLVPNGTNDTEIVQHLLQSKNISELFKYGLSRSRNFAKFPSGIYSQVSNDDVLLNFGYVPEFNSGDGFVVQQSADYLDMALEMGHDYCYPHSHLAQPKEILGKRLEFTLPLPKTHRIRDMFINDLLGNIGACQLTWLGPNPAMMGLLRACVLGARYVDHTLTSDQKITDAEHSEGVVGEETKQHFTQDYKKLADKAQAILATKGIFADEYDPQLQDVIFQQLCVEKVSDANEEAAMLLLYSLTVMISGSFQRKLSTDAAALTQAIQNKEPGAYTALQYGHQKKLLINHLLHTLATRLGLANQKEHVWHKNLL